jgi:hypothetical protein
MFYTQVYVNESRDAECTGVTRTGWGLAGQDSSGVAKQPFLFDQKYFKKIWTGLWRVEGEGR